MKLLEVTSNKMDKMIEAINDLKEETKLNRIKSSEDKGEVQAAVAKVGENIVKELHSIGTSQNRAFQSMMADSDLKQLEIKLPEWKNLLNESKMAYFDFLKNGKDAETYSAWRDNNPPLIPKRFQPKPITGERNEQ